MKKTKDSRKKRHEQIRNLLISHNLLSVAEFCRILDCSEATIRNDLRYLEEQGFIQRTFGGAIATANTTYNTDVLLRTSVSTKEKEAIADYVIHHILVSGQIITLDAGSTNVILAQKIVESPLELTVITNSFAAASILSKSERINLYLVGGYYNPLTYAFLDEMAPKILESIRSDIFFLAPNGLSKEAGITISDPKEVFIKQTMIRHARQCIALADHSKIGKLGLKVICGFEALRMLVTDDKADVQEIARLEESGVRVVAAPSVS
jgi:DeoR/GlpR family transcriptional regulator of sugar metabolism